MKLVINGIYDYGFYKNIRLIACDVESGEVVLKDKNGDTKKFYLDLFRKYGKLINYPNKVVN